MLALAQCLSWLSRRDNQGRSGKAIDALQRVFPRGRRVSRVAPEVARVRFGIRASAGPSRFQHGVLVDSSLMLRELVYVLEQVAVAEWPSWLRRRDHQGRRGKAIYALRRVSPRGRRVSRVAPEVARARLGIRTSAGPSRFRHGVLVERRC
jgi:hypothetical protein